MYDYQAAAVKQCYILTESDVRSVDASTCRFAEFVESADYSCR